MKTGLDIVCGLEPSAIWWYHGTRWRPYFQELHLCNMKQLLFISTTTRQKVEQWHFLRTLLSGSLPTYPHSCSTRYKVWRGIDCKPYSRCSSPVWRSCRTHRTWAACTWWPDWHILPHYRLVQSQGRRRTGPGERKADASLKIHVGQGYQ